MTNEERMAAMLAVVEQEKVPFMKVYGVDSQYWLPLETVKTIIEVGFGIEISKKGKRTTVVEDRDRMIDDCVKAMEEFEKTKKDKL